MIDITIQETVNDVEITVNQTVITVNVTRTTGGGGGGVESVTGDLVDNTDPLNPIINTPSFAETLAEDNKTNDIPIVSNNGMATVDVNDNQLSLSYDQDSINFYGVQLDIVAGFLLNISAQTGMELNSPNVAIVTDTFYVPSNYTNLVSSTSTSIVSATSTTLSASNSVNISTPLFKWGLETVATRDWVTSQGYGTLQTLAETLAVDNKTNDIPIVSNNGNAVVDVNDAYTSLSYETQVFAMADTGVQLYSEVPVAFDSNVSINFNTPVFNYNYEEVATQDWVISQGFRTGTVTSVTGVGGETTVATGTTTPVIGISSTYTSARDAYADAKVADAIVNGVTTVAPSQNAVFDALALKAKNFVLGKKANASSALTGTNTETILESIFVPAGSVAVDDIIYIRNRVFKTGAIGGFTVRYRINSSNSISGSSVLGFANLAIGATRSQGMERTLNLRASNTIDVIDNTTSIAYENSSLSNPNVNITFTFTSDFWILITGQLGSGGDSMVNSNYIIQKF